jgi:long-chain acyl-CoA synthetase
MFALSSVRICISGAVPLPMEVQERFGAITGCRLVEGYGRTKGAPSRHCNPLFGLRKPGSIGIPLSDVEAKVVDLESDEPIPPGADTAGELLIRGPQVMRGYWNRPEDTLACLSPDGWLMSSICIIPIGGL